MSANTMLVEGNLALVPEYRPESRVTVLQGGKPAVQGHTRPSVPVVLFLCVLASIVISVYLGVVHADRESLVNASSAVQFQEIKVSVGDSLWSLAEEHPASGLSTRETSDLIRSKNHLTRGSLSAGSYLQVPVSR